MCEQGGFMAIKAIVFDFGGVLIEWNPRNLYRKIFKNESDMEFFLKNICTTEWNLSLDKGKPFKQAVAERIALFPEYADEIRAFDDRWNEMRGGAIAENVALLRRLAKHYPVYGLTNWSEEKFAQTKPEFDFFNLFKGIVVSGIEKEVKPEPRIFEILLERYGLNPQECVFIDDSQPNVDTAEAMGFKALRFTTPDKLAADLKSAGVDTD